MFARVVNELKCECNFCRQIYATLGTNQPMTIKNQKSHIHVSAGLIRKDGQFLISKRQKGAHLEGYWEFPGGKQEKGESIQNCLEREIEEELDLQVQAGRVSLIIEHEYETKVISLHVMDCAILEGEPRAIECQEFKWVVPEDFEKFVFPPPDIQVIEFLAGQNNNEDDP